MNYASYGFGGGNYFRAPAMANLFSPPRQVNYSRAGYRSNTSRKKNTFLPLLLIGALLLALSKSKNNPLSNLFGGGNKPNVSNNNNSSNNAASTNTVAPTGGSSSTGSGSTTGGGSVTGGGSTGGGGGTTPTTKNAVVDTSDPDYDVITIDGVTDLKIQPDDASKAGIQVLPKDEIIVNGPINNSSSNNTDGGVIQGGNITRPFVKPDPTKKNNFNWNNGIFGRDKKGKYFLMTYDQWDKAKKNNNKFEKTIDFAFQNGPMLIRNGTNQVPTSAADTKKRSAMGIDKNGKLVVLYTNTEATMADLAKKCETLGLTNTIYLDGDDSWAGYIDDGKQKGNLKNGAAVIHIQT